MNAPKRFATVRPLRRPPAEPGQRPEPRTESGVRPKFSPVMPMPSELPPAAAALALVEERVTADRSRDPRCED